MNRSKLFLSIIIMAGFIIIGIILPTMLKKEHHQSVTIKDKPDSETSSIELDFIEWEQLALSFSEEQILLLKEQLPKYLIQAGKTDVNSVRFLPDATTYPQDSNILIQFVLSDSSILAVNYSTKEGTFFFGKERLQIDKEVQE